MSFSNVQIDNTQHISHLVFMLLSRESIWRPSSVREIEQSSKMLECAGRLTPDLKLGDSSFGTYFMLRKASKAYTRTSLVDCVEVAGPRKGELCKAAWQTTCDPLHRAIKTELRADATKPLTPVPLCLSHSNSDESRRPHTRTTTHG